MSGSTVSPYGQQNPQPHENRQPYLTIIFGIAHTGILPVKNAP
jgi:microcystin-dependent protein